MTDPYPHKAVQELFKKNIREQFSQHLMGPQEYIWIMKKGHSHKTRHTGLYYRHHLAYFHKAKGPHGEMEGLI
jgi:hypothetical protein